MINTQTQIDSLIDLAVLQRTELKQLVDSLPQLRDHLSSEIERNLEEIEPAIRSELEQFVAARALDTQAKTSAELTAKLDAMARNLESTTAAKYSVLMAERAQNATLLAQAEARIAEAASALPGAVKGIVTDELARFPRAGEIDQLRKEFAEPRGLNPRGRWQASETYNKLDLVSYNGDSYVSNTDGNREKPSRSSEAWTLSAARGNGGAGGGVTSLTDLVAVPANGELLIGNGSAFVNNTLTAGTGVTITNGPGTITIDASGAQELLTATVTNAESVAITRGQVVYLFGAVGNRASVKLANNATDAESSKTFGVVSETSIAAGANGLVTCVGTVDKLALGSYTEGDVLYLGATPGSVTATKPYAPNHLVYVGIVERANNGNGELYVRIQNGFELDEIHDVQITSAPLAGSLLMRDATNSLWKANRLTGTANQVTVTNADTSVTLSLPTTIANVNSVTAATSQNLTLAGGSTGASLVLGQGANAGTTLALKGTGRAKTQVGTDYNLRTFLSGTTVQIDGANDAENSYRNVSIQALKLSLLDSSGGNVLIGGTTDIAGSGGLKVFGTTAASSTTSGALQVAGGVGVGGAGWFGGAVTVNGDATFAGNVIVAQNKFSNFDGSGVARMGMQAVSVAPYSVRMLGSADAVNTRDFSFGYYTGDNAANTWNQKAAINSYTGAATFAGAVTAGGNFSVAGTLNNVVIGKNTDFPNYNTISLNGSSLGVAAFTGFLAGDNTDKTFYIQVGSGGGGMQFNTAGNTSRMTISNAGLINVTNTTPSTGAGSGALQVAGGIYAGAASVFGGAVTVNGGLSIPSNTFLSIGTYGGATGFKQDTPTTDSIEIWNKGLKVALISQSQMTMLGAAGGGRFVNFATGTTSASLRWVTGADGTAESGSNAGSDYQIHRYSDAGASLGTAFSITRSTGAATFAGVVTAPSATIKRASTSEDAFINFYTGGSPYWTVGLQAVGTSNDFRIVNPQSGNRSLSISTTTEAATFAGTVIAPAATTVISSVRLPHGTAPTSPVNGDMWTTTAGLYVRINGVTVGPLS